MLSNDCCDPWLRRAVRVSMGHIFRMPILKCTDLAAALNDLGKSGVKSYAAVIDGSKDYPGARSGEGSRAGPSRWCVVVGNEDVGVRDTVRAACTHSATIDMPSHVDSLSITVAAGILLAQVRGAEPMRREADEGGEVHSRSVGGRASIGRASIEVTARDAGLLVGAGLVLGGGLVALFCKGLKGGRR